MLPINMRKGVCMYDENQLVEIRWANKTRKYYESKGYEFTKYGDVVFVKAKDLMPGARVHINVICDFCGKEYSTTFVDYMKRINKDTDSCYSCKSKKQGVTIRGSYASKKFAALRKVCDEKIMNL